MYRNRGDSSFEDITDEAGVAVLDDTAQSLFADVDNDGDQDLVVATSTGLLLFVNDGKGRFTFVADAFRLAQPFQGVLTSIAMADYDRDGFLDLYVCVYSYLFGAGEDKAGTPAPYHDARNGPPSVLFRNDGRGGFVDVTADAGLDSGNDHYHFAAAWADYDGDGWPDLLVANDFGTKNLYRNLGRRNGTVTFEDVAASAGLLDHGAGMSDVLERHGAVPAAEVPIEVLGPEVVRDEQIGPAIAIVIGPGGREMIVIVAGVESRVGGGVENRPWPSWPKSTLGGPLRASW